MRYIPLLIAFLSVSCFGQLPDTVYTGSAADAGDGDPLRDGIIILNANDAYLDGRADQLSDSVQMALTPAGATTNIQYNNAGAFGGSTAFIWDNDTTSLEIGNDFATTSVNPTILLSKDILGAENGHGISDENKIDLNAGKAYASYDNRITIIGTVNLSHSVGYQAAPTYSSTGTIERLLGVSYVPTVTAGIVTSAIGYRLNDGVVSPGAEITNYYGLYASETINSATNNWFLYNAGTTVSYLGGYLGIKDATPSYEIDVTGDIRATGELYYGTGPSAVSDLEILSIRTSIASDTIEATDKAVLMNVGSANTLTIVANAITSLDIGQELKISSIGTGQTTITEGAGVTINSLNGYTAIEDQYGVANLLKINTDSWLLEGDLVDPSAPYIPPTSSETHPITHDQLYIVPSDVVNGDYIGEVHYNCTDSIFNDRTDTYLWSIISGNYGTAFSIDTDGLLAVNLASAVTDVADDFTLEVQITNGSSADTAECTIIYRENMIYVDLDVAGDAGAGTRADPHGIGHDYGQYTGDTTVLFKRGSSGISPTGTMSIYNNTGDWLVYGAYGQGAKPIFLENTSADTRPFFLGFDDDGAPFAEATSADSVILMDLKVYCNDPNDGNGGYDNAVHIRRGSDHDKLYRMHFVQSGGDASVLVRGEVNTNSAHKFYDIQGDSTITERVLKLEAGGSEVVNLAQLYGDGAFLYTSAYAGTTLAPMTAKYLYTEAAPGGSNNYPLDIRDGYCTIEYAVVKGWGIAMHFQEYDYASGYPVGQHQTMKNMIIEDCGVGTYFSTSDGPPYDPWSDLTFENIYMSGMTGIGSESSGVGFDFGRSSAGVINTVNIINCIVIGSDSSGVSTNSSITDLTIENSIFYGNGGNGDIDVSAGTGEVVRNTIFQTSDTDTQTNYDYDTGDPFVDKANGDYRTADGITLVIDKGTNISQANDIINAVINKQDIGPFERTLTVQEIQYNWTDR